MCSFIRGHSQVCSEGDGDKGIDTLSSQKPSPSTYVPNHLHLHVYIVVPNSFNVQKYRLGKQARKDTPELKGGGEKSSCDDSNSDVLTPDIGIMDKHGLPLTEALRYQIHVQAKLREQLEVQKKLQTRIEVQGKYLQTILEKAHDSFSFGTMMTVAKVGEKEETTHRRDHGGATVFREMDGEGRADESRLVSLDLNVNNETFSGFRPCDLQLGLQPHT